MPFLDQQAATTLSEAHALLFGWTTALWGRPILLVDTEGAIPSGGQPSHPGTTNEVAISPEGIAAEVDDSLPPTQTFWPPSPTREQTQGVHVLARQTSHRRRRMHALFADDNEANDFEQEDEYDRHQTDSH